MILKMGNLIVDALYYSTDEEMFDIGSTLSLRKSGAVTPVNFDQK